MTENNYHSRLLDISKKFDHVIERLKGSYIDEKYHNWIVWLMLAPFRDLAKIKDLQDGILKFFNSSILLSVIPVVSASAGSLVFSGVDIPDYVKPILSGLAGYLFSLVFYFPLLLSFRSVHFHTGAYRTWRRQEYNLFRAAFLDNKNDFYFKGVYDFVTSNGEVYHLIDKRLGDFLQNERTDYKSEIKILQDQLQKVNKNTEAITEKYKNFTADLLYRRDESLRETEYLIQLLKDINMLMFRMFNGSFTKKDLNIITGFTLYELRGDKLVLIEDVQTSAASPKEINIHDKNYAHYGAVRVILDNAGSVPYVNDPYSGHRVVSFRMNMDKKGIWVYNFHFDESDTRAWNLLGEDGKIDSREIYRLVHALCLHSLEDGYFEKKEAVNE